MKSRVWVDTKSQLRLDTKGRVRVDAEGRVRVDAEGWALVDAEGWALVETYRVSVEAEWETDRGSCLNDSDTRSVWYLTRLIGARFVPRYCTSSSSVDSNGAIDDRLRFPAPSLSS